MFSNSFNIKICNNIRFSYGTRTIHVQIYRYTVYPMPYTTSNPKCLCLLAFCSASEIESKRRTRTFSVAFTYSSSTISSGDVRSPYVYAFNFFFLPVFAVVSDIAGDSINFAHGKNQQKSLTKYFFNFERIFRLNQFKTI